MKAQKRTSSWQTLCRSLKCKSSPLRTATFLETPKLARLTFKMQSAEYARDDDDDDSDWPHPLPSSRHKTEPLLIVQYASLKRKAGNIYRNYNLDLVIAINEDSAISKKNSAKFLSSSLNSYNVHESRMKNQGTRWFFSNYRLRHPALSPY